MTNVSATESALFTPTEAAVLTQLPLKAVNNAIDRKTIPARAGRRSGRATRLLDLQALVSLTLERRLAARFQPDLRRELFGALASPPRRTISLEGGLLRIDLREPRRELAASLRELRRARQIVHRDPEIMGGQPVFKGTRLSPHAIAELLDRGSTAAELVDDLPSLTAEMARLAPVYAAAYPEMGRPRRQPWHGQKPVETVRRKLAPVPGA